MVMGILHDPRNKPAEEFFIFLKIQVGRRRSKVKNRSNLTPQITFRLRIWIRLIRFGQYLAWAYYLTLETSLRKNFSFFSKSKMAAGGQSAEDSHCCRGLPLLPIHIFCNNLDPAHRIQTKFGMDILLDPWNKPAKEFFIFFSHF